MRHAARYTVIDTARGERLTFRTATELCDWLKTAPTADLLQLSMMTATGAEVDAMREQERRAGG